jgi:hypothetical protein
VHSWIFRQRLRLEQLYGLPPGRPAPRRPAGGEAARAEPPPAGPARRPSKRLPERVLVPAPRRAA